MYGEKNVVIKRDIKLVKTVNYCIILTTMDHGSWGLTMRTMAWIMDS